MRSIRSAACVTIFAAGMLLPAGAAIAAPSPNGPGQPGVECGDEGATARPGHTTTAPGSPFNEAGISGTVYAGSDDTASLAHTNSTHAVSQYDVACLEVT